MEKIKPKTLWITMDSSFTSYVYLWNRKPVWKSDCWLEVGGSLIGTFCQEVFSNYMGKIPKWVLAGGENAIAEGDVYMAADWEKVE